MGRNTTQSTLVSLLKGGVFSFIGIIVHGIAGIGLRIILARYLTPEEFGIVNLGLAVMIIVASLSVVGYTQGVTRFAAFFNGKGETAKTKASIIAVVKFVIVSGSLAGLLIFGFSQKIATIFFHNKGLIPVLKILAIAIPLFALTKVFNGGLRGLKKINLMIITENILWRVLPLGIFLCLFISYGLRTVGAAYAFLFTVIIMCIISGLFLFRQISPYPKTPDGKTCFREVTRYSWPLALVNITNQLKGRTDALLLGFFMGASEVGVLAVALTLASLLSVFLSSVVTIFNPVASELCGQENTQEVARSFSLVTKWLIFLTLPVLLFLIFFSERSVTILFGDAYKSAAPVLGILSVCFFVKAAVGPTGATLLAIGHSKINMVINTVTLGVSIVLNVLLIPRYGIIGAALATGFASVFQQFSMLFVVKKYIRLHLAKKRMLLYAVYCIALILCTRAYFGSYIRNLLSLSMISILFYFAALFGTVITGQLKDGEVPLIASLQRKLKPN